MKRKALAGVITAALIIIIAALAAVLASSKTRYPQPSDTLLKDTKLRLDTGNISEGYFMAGIRPNTARRYKLRVIKDGVTLTYDIKNDGTMEVFPLQLGNGNYKIALYENISGKSYSNAGSIHVNVRLSDENVPFLYPSQYVWYTEDSEIVDKADTLCENKTDEQAFDAVCRFMKNSFGYDFIKATTIKAGTMPDIDGCYAKKKGVCQDLAAITVGMLRSQGIPAKLMIGYADKSYHAWVSAIVDGKEEFFDPTAAIGALGKVKKYTVERFY
ncbi:MAG: transglutaminase family protein [Clostridia bacterium]|nr:transglutaminase family protein [Clostridia bacterium]